MKIAYLILAHSETALLHKLTRAIKAKHSDIFIHLDNKVDLKRYCSNYSWDHVIFLPNRVNVNWGGFSQVQASLNLLTFAHHHDTYDFYVLLSGVDYPIRSNNYIHELFSKNKGTDFINTCEMPNNGKRLDRLNKFFIEYPMSNRFLFGCVKIANLLLKKLPYSLKLPKKYSNYKLCAGSSWWAINRLSCNYILDFVRSNHDFVKFYKHTQCPDEMFFQTILGNAPSLPSMKPSLTFADFPKESEHPNYISFEHVSLLKKRLFKTSYGTATFLFARKFQAGSGPVLQLIDQQLRSKSVTYKG